MELTRNQRGIWTSRSLKLAAGGANLIPLNQDVQQLLVPPVIPRGTYSGPWSRDQAEWTFGPESWVEASRGKRSVGEGCGENGNQGIGLGVSGMPLRCLGTRNHFPTNLCPSAYRLGK